MLISSLISDALVLCAECLLYTLLVITLGCLGAFLLYFALQILTIICSALSLFAVSLPVLLPLLGICICVFIGVFGWIMIPGWMLGGTIIGVPLYGTLRHHVPKLNRAFAFHQLPRSRKSETEPFILPASRSYEEREPKLVKYEGFYKAREKGSPRTDVEQVAARYNISENEAKRWLKTHSIEGLLPPRGTGITSGRGAGTVTNLGGVTSLRGSSGEEWKIVIGVGGGIIIGAAFVYLLR